MFKRILSLVLCLAMVAGMIPHAAAYSREYRGETVRSVDQCCHTLRVDTVDINYVRPEFSGRLIEITPQRVEDHFRYLDEVYIDRHPEAALVVDTGDHRDQEMLLTLAQTITEGCTTNTEKANAIDRWLYRNIYYEINSSAYAYDTFYNRIGNCLSYANLMQFLLRSLGIPAVVGDGWRGDMKTETVDLFNYEGHAWCFVYLEGEWVLYDPLWLECGTTDRDYIAEWIYLDTVEFITPAYDGDNLPPEAWNKPKIYYTDGKWYNFDNTHPNGYGNFTQYVNNQGYNFTPCQDEMALGLDGGGDGWYILDGVNDKSGMQLGEIYCNSWLSYGEYENDGYIGVTYAHANGMQIDGAVMEYDGVKRYMQRNTSFPILADESDYTMQYGCLAFKPGYQGPFLDVSWGDAYDTDFHIVTWESDTPEVCTVDQNGILTAVAPGFAQIRLTLTDQEGGGYYCITYMNVCVSDENRVPDYSDKDSCEHSYEAVVTEPTCQAGGYTTYTCLGCGDSYVDNYTDPVDHSYEDGSCIWCGRLDALASGNCGKGGDEVTWALLEDGTMRIFGTGRMVDFNSYTRDENGDLVYAIYWDDYFDRIKTLIVEEGVTAIGDHAFLGASELTTVILADSVTEIGNQVFSGCGKLESVAFGTGLTETGIEVFRNCEALTEITLPAGNVEYGNSFFSGCTNLRSVTIPDTQTTLGNTMFRNCKALTQIELPESITEIGSGAFEGSGLMSIEIPATVLSMNRGVFENCDSLTEVEIPGSISKISPELFKNCDNLVKVTIREGVTEMSYGILANCPNVTEITIPSTVTTMSGTFEYAIGLKKVTFTGNAPAISGDLFYGVTLTAYYPANSDGWTADVMQQYGGTVTWVPYTPAAEEIASGICGVNLTWALTDDGTLTISGEGEMYDYRESPAPWADFRYDIISVIVGEGTANIGESAFDRTPNLTRVFLPESLRFIDNYAFYNCQKLESINLPDGLESIGQLAFQSSALKSVVIPASVTFLDSGAFTDSTALTDVLFLSDPNLPGFAMGNALFLGCTALEEIRVEEGHIALRSIDGALYYCYDNGEMLLNDYPGGRKNPQFWIAENTVSINQKTFWAHPWLEEVTVPATVNTIGDSAFTFSNIHTIHFEGSMPQLGDKVFRNLNLTISYPCGDSSWDNREKWNDQSYLGNEGSITWQPDHAYESAVTNPTCTEQGYTTYTCLGCGDSYADNYTDALGHAYEDGHCTRCGAVDPGAQKCGDNAFWTFENGTLTISGEGEMYDYCWDYLAYENRPWADLLDQIHTVVVEDGITYIGEAAFFRMPNLTDVSLPDSVLSIGRDALAFNPSLKEITLPANLREIYQTALQFCTGLTELTLPASLMFLDNICEGCTGLKKVTILSDPELPAFAICDSVFRGCTALEEIQVVGEHILLFSADNALYAAYTLNDYALNNPAKELTIVDGATEINNFALMRAQNLERITIPASVYYIGVMAFAECHQLESVTFLGDAPQFGYDPFFDDELTVYYPTDNATWTEDVMQQYGGNITWVSYTPAAEEIANGICGDNLTWVLDQDGVLTISGTGAMYDFEYAEAPWNDFLEEIEQVVIAEGVTRIGQNAFREAVNLTAVSLSVSLTEIGNWAFMHAENLTAITLPQNLAALGQQAFMNCYSLEEIELPGSLTFIDSGAFTDCTALTRAVIHGDPDIPSFMMGNSPFRGCTSLEAIEVDENHFCLKDIDGVLYNYSGEELQLMQYPAGKKDAVFEIPQGTIEIFQLSMENVAALEEVTIPDTVRIVAGFALSNCTNLRTIRFLGDAPTIRNYALSGVTATIHYPAGNATWTKDVMQNYGGTLTWVPCEDAEEEYTVRWYSGSTSLNGTIDLNMYVILSENLVNDPETFVRFTFDYRVVDVPMAEALKSTVSSGETAYRFTCPLFAKQVADSVLVQVMRGDTPVGEPKAYSAMQYCKNLIRKNENPKQVAMCKAMLNYATAAQLVFNYNTDNLANASLSEEDKNLPMVDVSAYQYTVVNNEPGIRARSATMMMESEIRIRVYFTLDAGRSIDEYTFTIDGVEVQPEQNDEGLWYIESAGIVAKEMEEMHEFQCGGISVTYGALSYVNSKLKDSNPLNVNLAKALYAYYIAAEELLG